MAKMSISSARHLTCQIRSLDFGNDISRGKFAHRISGDDISHGKYVHRIFVNEISRVILRDAIYETWNFSSLVELSPLG